MVNVDWYSKISSLSYLLPLTKEFWLSSRERKAKKTNLKRCLSWSFMLNALEFNCISSFLRLRVVNLLRARHSIVHEGSKGWGAPPQFPFGSIKPSLHLHLHLLISLKLFIFIQFYCLQFLDSQKAVLIQQYCRSSFLFYCKSLSVMFTAAANVGAFCLVYLRFVTTATEGELSQGQMEKWLWAGWVWSGRVPFRPLVLLLHPFPLLVPRCLSLSLPSDARGEMERRKARERRLGNPVSNFPFSSPPAPAERVTGRRLGTSQPHLD